MNPKGAKSKEVGRGKRAIIAKEELKDFPVSELQQFGEGDESHETQGSSPSSYDEEWKNEEGGERGTLIRNGISFSKSHRSREGGGTKLS